MKCKVEVCATILNDFERIAHNGICYWHYFNGSVIGGHWVPDSLTDTESTHDSASPTVQVFSNIIWAAHRFGHN